MTALAERPRTLPRGTADGAADIVDVRLNGIPPSPYRKDPVGFCRDVLRFEPWSKQRALLESVRDNRRTAVRSCHGVGKTAAAAAAVIWFHKTFPDSRVISTAPTFKPGVKDLLWREVRALYARAGGRAALESEIFDTRLERGDKWFAEGYSTDVPERFSGHHAPDLLLVVDEASGVDESIFEAAEGFLTAENARVLLIGNPTQLAGQFHRAFHTERSLWSTVHISAFDAPWHTGEAVSEEARRNLITETWVEEKRRKWGERSSLWQIRVRGDFPSTADDTVCAVGDVERAQLNGDLSVGEPAVVACDVARFGSDETVIGVRRGPKFRVVDAYVGKPTTETAGKVLRAARELFDRIHETVVIVIDDVGVGGGVTDILREELDGSIHFPLVPFNGGHEPHEPDEYPNRRSEVWFSLSDRLPRLDLDPGDDELLEDLVAPRYSIDHAGRRVVERKDETKKRLGRSPDRGDTAVMAFSVPTPDSLAARRAQSQRLYEQSLEPQSLTGDLLTRKM